MTKPAISGIAPFFIVKNVPAARWPAEFSARNVQFSEPLKDTDDRLRGFELEDADGCVLFFGRPREAAAARASVASRP